MSLRRLDKSVAQPGALLHVDPTQEEDPAQNRTRCQALPLLPVFMLSLKALSEFRYFPASPSFVKSGEII